jgi:hypothetical protein
VARGKLLSAICGSPKNVRLADACKAAEELWFTGRTSGGHHAFSKTGEPVGLNFQNAGGGKIPPYQAKQLVRMIEKHWNFDADRLKTQDEIDADPSEQANNGNE